VAEVSAAEAAAAEAAAAVDAVAAAEAAAAVEFAAAAGGASKAAADAPGAEAALSPELPKGPDGGADGMAEDAEEIPGRPEELKTRGGSLSSEGANAADQAERSTPRMPIRSLQQSNALILNAITTLYLSSEIIFMVASRCIFILIMTLLHHRNTATTKKLDFKNSHLTSVGAIN
jgi:hypothetical protein